jgi:hypothetical protein
MEYDSTFGPAIEDRATALLARLGERLGRAGMTLGGARRLLDVLDALLAVGLRFWLVRRFRR